MYICPQCKEEVGEHETLCPHCSQNISPLSVAQKQQGDKRVWIEFIGGFMGAFLLSCSIPRLLIGVLISSCTGLYLRKRRPSLSKGILLGAFVGLLGASCICLSPFR